VFETTDPGSELLTLLSTVYAYRAPSIGQRALLH